MSIEKNTVMSANDTAEANKLIASKVVKTWKSGVSNKLLLAEKVYEGYTNILRLDPTEFANPDDGFTDGAAMNRKIKDLKALFLKSLPFGEGVADKFNRIGGTSWLYDPKLDRTKLPNCYNTLDKLSGKSITNNAFVLGYIKKKLNESSRVWDVAGWVKAALEEERKAEEEKSRSKGAPDPETDLSKFVNTDASSTSEGSSSSTDGVSNDNTDPSETSSTGGEDSGKSRKTIAFKVMIDPAEITASKENFTSLIGLFDEIETLISDNEKIVSCEVVESVKNKLKKVFTDAAVKAAEDELSLAA